MHHEGSRSSCVLGSLLKPLYSFNSIGTRRVVSGNYFGGDIKAAHM